MTCLPNSVKMDEYEKHKQDFEEIIAETDQVILNLEEFPYGKIARIINTCSTQIMGLTTSGSAQMSHNEKRVRAGEYLNGAMERILDENYVGLTFTADSDSFDLMNRISGELSGTQLENGRINKVLEGYSIDLDSLANHVAKSQDLNINVDSDLGDNDNNLAKVDPVKIELKYVPQATPDSPCESCDGKCKGR